MDALASCLLVSDFNVGTFAGYLANDTDAPQLEVVAAPYGHVMPTLLDAGAEVWTRPWNATLVWTRPEAIVESFAALLEGEIVPEARTLDEVDTFCSAVADTAERSTIVLVATWTAPAFRRGAGVANLKPGGAGERLLAMNQRMVQRLASADGVYVLDASRWMLYAGDAAYSPKHWYMAKVPFGREVFKQATLDVKAALRAIVGDTRKLLVLDLDNTLWGGVVGDDGWQNLTLGGHDPLGEAHADLQRELRALRMRGVLLAIASKNTESVALEAIRSHPEMRLHEEDFASWRINWEDKARNLVEIVEELNLGLQSTVFLDDNAAERARVRETLPEVLVPDWPSDPMLYPRALLELRCFDAVSLSDEDRRRTELYASERQRDRLRTTVGSVEDWLASLELRVKIEELNQANLERATQLLNKTNQMNLSTRRLTKRELWDWACGENRKLWTFRVADRFADAGLSGITSLEWENGVARVVDFVLSCRVFGRNVERVMVDMLAQHARSVAATRLEAKLLPTAKNQPTLRFFCESGLDHDAQCEVFVWDLTHPYPAPKHVKVLTA